MDANKPNTIVVVHNKKRSFNETMTALRNIKPFEFDTRTFQQKKAYAEWCTNWHVNAGDIEFFGGPKRRETEAWLRDEREFSPTELYAFATGIVRCITEFNLIKIFNIKKPAPTINEVYDGLKSILDQPRVVHHIFEFNMPKPVSTLYDNAQIHLVERTDQKLDMDVKFRPSYTLDDFSFNNMEDSGSSSSSQRAHYHGRVAFPPRGMAPRGGM